MADFLPNADGDQPSLDLLARRVVMASLIYYGLGESIVSDDEFDAWCKRVAKRWSKLDRIRQWQLGSPEEIRASGFHVKVTWASVGGSITWMKEEGLWPKDKRVVYTSDWNRSKKHRVDWLTPDKFRFEELPKPAKKQKRRIKLFEKISPKRERVKLESKSKRVRL